MPIVTWEPDTCDCVLNIEYDEKSGVESGTVLNTSTICDFHSGKNRGNIIASAISDHGRRKNHLLADILARFPGALGKTDENGNLVFKDDRTIVWSFSGTADSRVLNISFTGVTLTNAQKTTLQNAANSRFGAGKIIIS